MPDLPVSDTLAHLVVSRPGVARVLHRHGLDFCCGGAARLEQACRDRGLDPEVVAAEIEAAAHESDPTFVRWDERSQEALIEHLLEAYHAPHRAELPRLVALAEKVERVHAGKAACPTGVREHLAAIAEELDLHMQKEERMLFPMLLAGRARAAQFPIQVMREEHEQVGRDLTRLRELAHDFVPPPEACTTWRALYAGLAEFEAALMRHVHLENNVLFARA